MGADGVGSLSVGAASNAQLLSGNRTLYLSASGNILLGGSTAAGGHDILIGVKADVRRHQRHLEFGQSLLGRGTARRFQCRQRLLRLARRARAGQADLEQALQSARRRRLRLHRHQLLCPDRRWHRDRRSHPDRPRRRRQSLRRRSHQSHRLRRLRNLFRRTEPAADRHRRLSESARRGQRRQFRPARQSDFARRVRHAVRHRPRQEQPDRRACPTRPP